MQTIALQHALLGRQKINQKLTRIGGHPQRSLIYPSGPYRNRGRVEHPVCPRVVGAGDFQR